MLKTKNAREAAYVALLSSLKGESYIADVLEQWRRTSSPSNLDFHFAQQIACGAAQMALALDFLAEQLSDKKKLSLKLKEKALLRLALYQFYYLDRIPLYAIVDESIKLAHKYCHRTFAGYLNAILRKVETFPKKLTERNSSHDLSIRFSYPEFFVERLLSEYGFEETQRILESENIPAPIMVRIRNNDQRHYPGMETITQLPFRVDVLKDSNLLSEIVRSPRYYIQNITPVSLMTKLAESFPYPKTVLDLCASPGGKLLAIHDLFPKANLFANDVSEQKLERLKENCTKYGLDVNISCGKGEQFTSHSKFDLIILDVPCSNTGVLNKRPEARWRLSKESLNELLQTQYRLLSHAATLVAQDGELWYLTCSILKDENENLIKQFCDNFGFKVRCQQSILPNRAGWDGGFGCALRR